MRYLIFYVNIYTYAKIKYKIFRKYYRLRTLKQTLYFNIFICRIIILRESYYVKKIMLKGSLKEVL